MLLPTAKLLLSGGVQGVTMLGRDRELREALGLTMLCATAATALAVIGGTPLAYALARLRFPGRSAVGARITGTATGIIAAMTFVAAPLFVAAAREAFEQVDPRLEGVARTLGDSRYRAIRRVTLP